MITTYYRIGVMQRGHQMDKKSFSGNHLNGKVFNIQLWGRHLNSKSRKNTKKFNSVE